MAFKVLCLTLALLAAASAAPGSRIYGGEHTTIENAPYVVALTYYYPRPSITVQRCVGSLLSSWHVMTSGFCFTGAIEDNFEVRAGSTNSLAGGVVVKMAQVIKHPDYEEAPRAGDIAVVFLETPLGITDTVNVAYLPPQNTYIPDGQALTVTSWGFEYDGGPQLETLKNIVTYKVSLAECEAIYEGSPYVKISDRVICANQVGRSMCFGDSGAPMVLGQVIVGTSSYFEGCGYDDYPDTFSRVDRYTDWILGVATAPGRNGTAVRTAPVIL